MDSAIAARLAALNRLEILDSAPEASFDSLVGLTAQIFDAPIAAISLLDTDRQWFKARIGLDLPQTDICLSFCVHAVATGERLLEVLDTRQDPRTADNPLVTGEPGLRYYAGAVIHAPTGEAIGSLCILDTRPRRPMSEAERQQLRTLADAVEDALRLRLELTLHRETEARLIRSEASYRMLSDHCHDILVRADRTGQISYASPSTRALGYAPDEVVGRNFTDFVPPKDQQAVQAALARLFDSSLTDEVMQVPYPVLTKGGDTVWLEGASSLVRDGEGRATEVVSVYRDVTAQRALQKRLEAAVEAKAAFLANMSHELRTPLTSVLGFSALLAKTPDMPRAASAHVARIATAGQALLALINDILDVSKLEAGHIELELEPTHIPALAEEVRDILSAQASVKGVALQVTDDLRYADRQVDSLRLRQVLLNLAGNAVKFTEQGAVRIRLAEAGAAGDRLRIEVIDSGPGIPEAHRKRLFQRFAQGDSSVTRKHGGSGLGLAISRELVELMDGEIGVENRERPGACFWVEIPAPRAKAETSRPEPSPDARSGPGLSGRVLIVDDHPVNRELVRLFIGSPDVTTAEADNGQMAIDRAMAEPFDLILMDVNMPVMDGLAATSAIRASCPLNADTPIIALTAQTGAEIEEKCFAAGMDAVLAKPIAHRDLLALAAQAMGPEAKARIAAA
ncbi:ATP-binding protein [Phenylobacterium sp.]|uniref:ATP-binding protein n=1 Tax=Phenylobacterium sp. TaxID=1871053 RepID=UPI00262E2255|nr:ATP-binding protein [Phenylobacterium sp.]